MSVKLSISIEEADLILNCFGFIKKNTVLSPELLEFRFVSGDDFRLTLDERCRLDLLSGYISEALKEAIETHPFNPYIKTF